MDKNTFRRNELLAQRVIKGLKSRNMDGYYAASKEDVLRQADRNVDLVYASFKDDFNRMQNSISEGLTFCMTRSKGKMKAQVNELSRQNEIVC